jgi:transcription initiation factor IIE alpha subunit
MSKPGVFQNHCDQLEQYIASLPTRCYQSDTQLSQNTGLTIRVVQRALLKLKREQKLRSSLIKHMSFQGKWWNRRLITTTLNLRPIPVKVIKKSSYQRRLDVFAVVGSDPDETHFTDQQVADKVGLSRRQTQRYIKQLRDSKEIQCNTRRLKLGSWQVVRHIRKTPEPVIVQRPQVQFKVNACVHNELLVPSARKLPRIPKEDKTVILEDENWIYKPGTGWEFKKNPGRIGF